MKALIQRVSNASVVVAASEIARIGPGLLILVCAMQGDDTGDAEKLARKIAKLRVFPDEAGKMNRALLDTGGAALVVSQFTLAADTSSGNRPGFSSAANPTVGKALYEHFADTLRGLGIETALGRFGAEMQVRLTNDGPVTIWLET